MFTKVFKGIFGIDGNIKFLVNILSENNLNISQHQYYDMMYWKQFGMEFMVEFMV